MQPEGSEVYSEFEFWGLGFNRYARPHGNVLTRHAVAQRAHAADGADWVPKSEWPWLTGESSGDAASAHPPCS
jgi:hypothetical protein